jgi:hypothetical protein
MYAGAKPGIFGNPGEEAIYQAFFVDGTGAPLNAAQHRYTLRFEKDRLPPAEAFWSVTMYDGKTQLLVENPINRYLINSSMLPQLTRDADGGLTLYVQHPSPGAAQESNWLAAYDRSTYAPTPPHPSPSGGRSGEPSDHLAAPEDAVHLTHGAPCHGASHHSAARGLAQAASGTASRSQRRRA